MSRWAIFHVIFGLSLMLVALTMLLNNNDAYKRSLENELLTTKSSVGNDSWEVINSRATRRHKENFYDNGVFETITNTFLSERDDYITRNIKESDDLQLRFVNNIQVMAYQMFFRITMMEYWLALLSPLCLCIILSGYYSWKRKQYQVGGASAGVGRLWIRAIWLLFIGLVAMLIIPPYIVSLSVYTPVVFLLMASTAISNYISSAARF